MAGTTGAASQPDGDKSPRHSFASCYTVMCLQKGYRWPAFVQGRPPEHPSQHPDVFFFDLRRSDDLVRVFGAVVAAHANRVARHPAQVLDAQHAVVLDGVDLSVDNLREPAINGDDGAVFDSFGHAVADHPGADGVGVIDFQGVEIAAWQANRFAGVFDDVGFVSAGCDGRFFVKGQFDVDGFDDPIGAADRLGVEGVAGVVDQT